MGVSIFYEHYILVDYHRLGFFIFTLINTKIGNSGDYIDIRAFIYSKKKRIPKKYVNSTGVKPKPQ